MFDRVRSSPGSNMTFRRMLRLTAGVLLLSLVSGSMCPDQQRCGDQQTCCQIQSGEFNCCPFHQGECCEDHLHCCPEGMLCEVKESRCTNATHSLPWAERFLSGDSDLNDAECCSDSDVPCDDTVACADGQTCCKNEQGEWDCCPLPQAVCCEDKIHCCPHDTKCNLPAESCDKSSLSVPWLKKQSSRPIGGQKVPEIKSTSAFNVPCDDTATCLEGSTCCKNEQGGWSCCPLPQAVCCEDFIHCCPHNTKCNLAIRSCDNSSGSVPWLKKEPSRPIGGQKVAESKGTSVSDVPCDDTTACPDGQTCCKDEQGGWSCCPFPQAVCCEDFIHCCPQGTTCNLAAQQCDNSTGLVPWLKKEPSRPTATTARNTSVNEVVVKCDPEKSCPDHTTCCFMTKSKKWGCCPLDQATCCADGENCCPKGYTCRDQFCEKNSGIKHKSVSTSSVWDTTTPQVQTDIDCGGGFSCKDTETCCKISETTWGCCPYTQAVCCSDMQHCCPAGYTCDESGSCFQAMGFDWEMFFSKKKRARAV
ncbi:granulin a [Hemibagrus wyckioides]|nr:granulin a [Hemibagrus wyckioides]